VLTPKTGTPELANYLLSYFKGGWRDKGVLTVTAKYRITSGRFDVTASTCCEFDSPGDVEATKKFQEVATQEANGWDTMWLHRIDQPAVSEQKTLLETVRDRKDD